MVVNRLTLNPYKTQALGYFVPNKLASDSQNELVRDFFKFFKKYFEFLKNSKNSSSVITG